MITYLRMRPAYGRRPPRDPCGCPRPRRRAVAVRPDPGAPDGQRGPAAARVTGSPGHRSVPGPGLRRQPQLALDGPARPGVDDLPQLRPVLAQPPRVQEAGQLAAAA